MSHRPTRPSTGLEFDIHNRKVTLYPDHQLVPLRTRYACTEHPELPGWRMQSPPDHTTRMNVTVTRPHTTRAKTLRSPPLPQTPRLQTVLSVPTLPRRDDPRTYTVVSPREVKLPVEPKEREIRVPEESSWVLRNIATVPRLHMHKDRITEEGLPPLTAPTPVAPVLATEPMLPMVLSMSTSEKEVTTIPEMDESSFICIRSQASIEVEDRKPSRLSIPPRPVRDVRWKEPEPWQISYEYSLFRKKVVPVEWVRPAPIQPTTYMKSRAIVLSPPTHLRVNSNPSPKPGDSTKITKLSSEFLLEQPNLSRITESPSSAKPVEGEPSSDRFPVIPDDVSRVQTARDDRQDLTERLALFRELFEGRRGVRSNSFSAGRTGSEVKCLFDVFMMELKRGSIKSREQAVSFIRDELKDSLVSDLTMKPPWSSNDSTRPSYFLCAEGSPQGGDTDSPMFQAFRKRRNRSLINKQEFPDTSPRLIRSSELKLRPRFADLMSVAVEFPDAPESRAHSFEVYSPTAAQQAGLGFLPLRTELTLNTEESPKTLRHAAFPAPDLDLMNLIDEKSKIPAKVTKQAETRLEINTGPYRRQSILKEALVHSVTPKPKRAAMIKKRQGDAQRAQKSRLASEKSGASQRQDSATTPEPPAPAASLVALRTDILFPIKEVSPSPPAPPEPPKPKAEKPPPTNPPALKHQTRRASIGITPEQTQEDSSSDSHSALDSEANRSSGTEKLNVDKMIRPVTWRNLFPAEAHLTVSDARRASVSYPKKYDIRVTDALDQFTLNMASSLLTSLALLALHNTKEALEKVKVRAVLDERRNIHKLAKAKKNLAEPAQTATKSKVVTSIKITKPIEDSEQPASLPQDPAKDRVLEAPKDRVSEVSKKSKKSKKRPAAVEEDYEPDRNFVSSNIDFELKHIEMLKRLTAHLEPSAAEHETPTQFVNLEGEAKGEPDEDGRRTPEEHRFHTDYGTSWIEEVMASQPPEDVEALLAKMMRDRNLKEMPFSSEISYGFGVEVEEDPRFVKDIGSIDPNLDPNLELKEELEIRKMFLQYCMKAATHEELEEMQKGVLFVGHKDSFYPAEMRHEVREAVKKRRYREHVLKERIGQKHVSLRARVCKTFSNLPQSITNRPRPRTGPLENLFVDGNAKAVKTELERRERIYLRIKNEKNLQKLSSSKSAFGLFSLSATVRELNTLSNRPHTRR